MFRVIGVISISFNSIALRMAKTPLSFGHSECSRVKGGLKSLEASCRQQRSGPVARKQSMFRIFAGLEYCKIGFSC